MPEILTWPSGLIRPGEADWPTPWTNTRVFASPNSRATQTTQLGGPIWRCQVTWPVLNDARRRMLAAFLSQLEGPAGRFYFGPYNVGLFRQGSAAGAPVVDGADQTGRELATAGWTPDAERVLAQGDYIAWDAPNGRRALHMVPADVDAAADGTATVPLSPPIRWSPAAGAPLIVDAPTCIMRLVDDEQGRMPLRRPLLARAALDLVEAVPV